MTGLLIMLVCTAVDLGVVALVVVGLGVVALVVVDLGVVALVVVTNSEEKKTKLLNVLGMLK